MRFIYLSIYLSVISMTVTIIVLNNTKSWLHRSGLYYFDNSLMNSIKLSGICTCLSTVILFYQVYNKTELKTVVLSFLIGTVSILEFYTGLSLVFDVRSYLSTFRWKWIQNLHSVKICEIQKIFNCCGFDNVVEFNHCFCEIVNPQPCLAVMSSLLKKPIKSTGFLMINLCISHLVSIGMVWMDLLNDKSPKYNDIEVENSKEAFLN
ncbi:hypothetical protein TRFO_05697 [Tritrichomonas foetus]|uniref:Tetraspanin family protein n=1 Tax=Tritrichomonas foetus TaxID=1144522 RepID=A0A1J4K4D3_9EUKA|nr:hypothetical protein TRFO_05697 [Tritrichomonas foetus]|eukprot:OHT06051.1 hypothetical protein TRFO_05697 [Tritrichomonas foetus]